MKNFFVLFFGMALAMSSCVKETSQAQNQEVLAETVVVKRGGPSCGPEGNCETTIIDQVINVSVASTTNPNLACGVQVVANVTRCTDPITGNVTVYFEEDVDGIDVIGPNGGPCPGVTPQWLEDAYTVAIFRYLESNFSNDAPLCGSGNFVMSSKQIKTQCQKRCIGPSLPGTTNYIWTPCATVQSCCIVTQEWCRDGEGNLVQSGLPSSEDVGECEGLFEGNCFQDIWPVPKDYNPCNTSRCE